MTHEIDARQMLEGLVGRQLETMSGQVNRILRIEGSEVIVATSKSPHGKPVAITSVQDALDRLCEAGELEISVDSVGYRSAFIGAVLATIPGTIRLLYPRRIRLGSSRNS
jgi:hypothetical protein